MDKKEFEQWQKAIKAAGVDAREVSKICNCSGCREERAALQKQLDHPFYKKVDDFRDEVKLEALTKAATKYNEPFNPASWSVRELGKHAMSENYDQGNYIVGLMDAAERLEKRNKQLELLLREADLKYKIATSNNKNRIEYQKELLTLYEDNKGVFIDEKI